MNWSEIILIFFPVDISSNYELTALVLVIWNVDDVQKIQ